MAASALLLGAAVAQAAPRRVASLNLCTDELLLMLAAPEQIASVTHLARQEAETPLWRRALRHPRNDGSLLSVIGHRPDLIVTMGGGTRDRLGIASRLGVRTLDLAFAQTLGDVAGKVRGQQLIGDASPRRQPLALPGPNHRAVEGAALRHQAANGGVERGGDGLERGDGRVELIALELAQGAHADADLFGDLPEGEVPAEPRGADALSQCRGPWHARTLSSGTEKVKPD